jgi:alkylhydroperoxidase family enzyme
VSRTKGLTDEEIAAVTEFRASGLFTEREKAALEYAEEMTKTPVAVPDELFARLRGFFDEDQLVELTSSIAYENYRARFYHALEIGSDGLYVCALPARQNAEG